MKKNINFMMGVYYGIECLINVLHSFLKVCL